jgi:hypothetical protein
MFRLDRKRPLFGGIAVSVDATVPFAAGAPTATGIGTDTSFTFAKRVRSVLIQNNTAAPLYANLDAAASPGTLAIAAGQTLILDWSCTVLHLYAAAATNVNGAVAGAIFVAGGAG